MIPSSSQLAIRYLCIFSAVTIKTSSLNNIVGSPFLIDRQSFARRSYSDEIFIYVLCMPICIIFENFKQYTDIVVCVDAFVARGFILVGADKIISTRIL